MKTMAVVAAVGLAAWAVVPQTAPVLMQAQQAGGGKSVTLPAISGSPCLAQYSGTHALVSAMPTLVPVGGVPSQGVQHWRATNENCPSWLIHYSLLPDGTSQLIFNSPARGPMASVPPAAVYAGTGASMMLQSASEGSGWPGSVTVN